MPAPPQNLPSNPFQGRLTQVPAAICKPIADNLGPRTVQFTIDWGDYGAPALDPIAVELNTTGQSVQQPLDGIRSVYVDNSQGDTIVYIYFGDTNFTLQCPAGAIIWTPVITGQTKAIIWTENFGITPPETVVHLCNFVVQGFYLPPTTSGATPNPVELSFLAIGVNNNYALTRNFANVNLGPQNNPVRLIVVAVSLVGNLAAASLPAASSVVVAGVGLTKAISNQVMAQNGVPANYPTETSIWYGVVPLGGSGAITVNNTTQTAACAIEVYRIDNYQSAVPISTDTEGAVSAATLVSTLGMQAGGVAVYCGMDITTGSAGGGGGATSPPVWSLDATRDIVQTINNSSGNPNMVWSTSASIKVANDNVLAQAQLQPANNISAVAWR